MRIVKQAYLRNNLHGFCDWISIPSTRLEHDNVFQPVPTKSPGFTSAADDSGGMGWNEAEKETYELVT